MCGTLLNGMRAWADDAMTACFLIDGVAPIPACTDAGWFRSRTDDVQGALARTRDGASCSDPASRAGSSIALTACYSRPDGGNPALSRRASYPDYLAAEQNSECRHELIDGVIVAMAGGSDEHNALTNKLAIVLGSRLTGTCRSYSSDQRFWIAVRARGRYADGSIICRPPEHPAHDDQATTNPTIVLEVLSPSTEGDDEGDKRTDFQSLASLRAYVLVAQDERRIKIYRRDGDAWSITSFRDGDTFELPILTSAVTVAEIYDGIVDKNGRSLLHG